MAIHVARLTEVIERRTEAISRKEYHDLLSTDYAPELWPHAGGLDLIFAK